MLVSEFIDRLALRLRDAEKRQWTQDYLEEATDAAFIAICTVIPQAYTEHRDITLVDGSEQTIDKDLHRIVHLTGNVCPTSGIMKRAITKVDLSIMDRQHPQWRQDSDRGYVWNYMLNSLSENKFYVWPPATAGMLVRGQFSKTPVVDGLTDMPFDNIHIPALSEYAMYYCLMRDDEQTGNSGRAMQHWQNFFQLLNVKETAEVSIKTGEGESEV